MVALLICFILLDVVALIMMVLTIRSCVRGLNPMYHIRNYPDRNRIRGQVLDIIPEAMTLESAPDRVT